FLFTKPSPSPLLAPAARHWHLLPLSCLPPPEFINPESTVALLRSSKPRQALPRRLQILVLPVPGRPSTVQWGTRSPPPPLWRCAPPSPPSSSSTSLSRSRVPAPRQPLKPRRSAARS